MVSAWDVPHLAAGSLQPTMDPNQVNSNLLPKHCFYFSVRTLYTLLEIFSGINKVAIITLIAL